MANAVLRVEEIKCNKSNEEFVHATENKQRHTDSRRTVCSINANILTRVSTTRVKKVSCAARF